MSLCENQMRFQLFRLALGLAIISNLGWLWATEPTAAETNRPIYERFAAVNGVVQTDEVPDFQKHVSPLLGRLGCNGRACHGSFQGQGGFILSLFGYDFKADHDAMLAKDSTRVDIDKVAESLILNKPLSEDEHGGGKRFEENSWQYWVLRKWIEAKAPFSSKEVQKLEKLVVTPSDILFREKGQSQQLKVVAHWKDGTHEDVTALARFYSNDPSISSVSEAGVVLAAEPGDTHVVVSYDNAVVPVLTIRPVSEKFGDKYPAQIATTKVDQLILAKLKLLGVLPSASSSDAEFLRRVSLDVTGTLPTTTEVIAFLNNSDPDKRRKKVDELLERPGYAALWTTFLCDITGNNEAQLNNFLPIGVPVANQWYQWLYKRVAENVPYDQIVEGIVTATSRLPDESYREYCQSMSEISRDKSGEEYAQRPGLVHYWARNNFKTAEDRAVGFAYTFLGIRIQCAQCHKHPFDQWSKSDFDDFEKLFAGVTVNQNTLTSDGKKEMSDMIKEINVSTSLKGNELRKALGEKLSKGETVPFPELTLRAPSKERVKGAKPDKKGSTAPVAPKAKLLGGEWVDMNQEDIRGLLMDWLRNDNPYFAKALVNRVWAHYFAVGIVHPADDLNLANAPSNAPLLDYLAKNFVANGYDMKWLHREILNSDAYQRSWETNETNQLDKRNFSHAQLKRLPAESAYDAVYMALANDKIAQELVQLDADRALSQSGASRQDRNDRNTSAYALRLFGRSVRESNCDCDRSNEPSLLQTVFLANDQDIHLWLSDPKTSWTVEVAQKFGWPTTVTNRRPSEKLQHELEQMVEKYQQNSKDRKELQQIKAFAKKNNLSDQLKRLLEMNGNDTNESAEVSSTITVEQANWIIDNAYLRTLSRLPKETEKSTAVAYLTSEAKPISAIQSLMWSLVNTKEFILNH
jgi:Protein of unknown function (DUF1549)/Protein of unknown function (DUF1553)